MPVRPRTRAGLVFKGVFRESQENPQVKSEWFETFFQGVAVESWARAIPPARTLAEADFLEQTLAPGSAGARLLDVPCAHGRHAIELARRGHQVTAIDLSAEGLERARRGAEAAGVSVDYRSGDMRALDLRAGEFDGAYCMGNSFCYLDRTNALAFLRRLARAVQPGGKLVIDTGTAAECILPAMPARRWYRMGDILMLSECRYAAEHSRMDIEYTFVQGANSVTHCTSSFVMTAAGIRDLLAECGFDVQALYGGIAGEPFQLGSPHLVVVARRVPLG